MDRKGRTVFRTAWLLFFAAVISMVSCGEGDHPAVGKIEEQEKESSRQQETQEGTSNGQPECGDGDDIPKAGQEYPENYTKVFQPTSPVRETTSKRKSQREELKNFNPRPPCGRRLSGGFDSRTLLQFQPTSPVRETTFPAQFCHN